MVVPLKFRFVRFAFILGTGIVGFASSPPKGVPTASPSLSSNALYSGEDWGRVLGLISGAIETPAAAPSRRLASCLRRTTLPRRRLAAATEAGFRWA